MAATYMIPGWSAASDLRTTPSGGERGLPRLWPFRSFRLLPPVIPSGGAGTRLWPLSRELYPKQLLALTGERTMLQQTALRLSGLAAAAPGVVCNEAPRFLVAEQLRQLRMDARAVELEPFGRNTAPAIALAALAALKM